MVLPLDSPLCLIYYLIWICRRQRISHYSLGRPQVTGSRRRLDDVSLELFHQEKRFRYLFRVHQRQFAKKNISFEALTSSSSELSLARCFEAYLKLKAELESPAGYELAVWTEATFRKRDLGVQQMVEMLEDGSGLPDLLEGGLIGVRRYRIKNSVELEEELLKSVDPMYKLAVKITRMLFAKLPIGPRNTSNGLFGWLVEHVFEPNAFKKEFLAENSTLSEETQLFRKYLEAVLHQQFQRQHIADFQLARIEQLPYSSRIEIHLQDHHITSDSQKRGWNFQNTSTIADARSFLASLAFYTNVPTAQTFQNVIHQGCSFNEGVCDELKRILRCGNTLNEKQIDAIFELDEFGKNKPSWVNGNLQFNLESITTLEAKLRQFSASKSTRMMMVEAGASVRLTLDRLARVAEEVMFLKRFIFVKDSNGNQLEKLMKIFEALEPVLHETLVVVPCSRDENVLCKIKRVTQFCQAVLVVDVSHVIEDGDLEIHIDSFSFADFTNDTQKGLFSKYILLQGREYGLTSLLSDINLSTIPMEAVIDWNACEEIIIGSPSCQNDHLDHFIERDFNSESGEVLNFTREDLNCITILSGEPGIGKSVFLEKMAQKSEHKNCVSILLNCRTKNKLFEEKEDVSEVLFKLLETKRADHFQMFLLKKLVEEKRIHLLLDDFDEVCKPKTVLDCIQSLGFHSVVIASRHPSEGFLKTNLINSVVCYLKPFNETDQLIFLKHGWKNVNSDEKLLENVIQNFQTIFNENFLRIPLNLKIAAMLHEEKSFTINTKNVAKIVEAFIDEKFSYYSNQYFNLSNRAHEIALKAFRTSFEVDHAELAFALECELQVDREKLRKVYPFGLLRIANDEVTFVDSAFQKYYVVQFLLTHHVEQKNFSRLMGEVLASSRLVEFLDHHISSADRKRDILGGPIVSEYMKSIPSRRNQMLPEIKAKQFYIFFQFDCSEGQLIDFIYSSVINNKFNVLEVIYDNIPTNLYNNIRFKFCPNDADPNIIDLSSVNENSIVILLDILCKKYPTSLIERVIANFTIEEPDFITKAIEQGFKRIIEQIFSINQSITSQEEVDLLQDYVELRWTEYLRLAIFNNRIEIVEIVLSSVAKKYHQRVIKAFLMEQLVLHVLAELCQNVDESAEEIVQLVVQFIEDNLSDYDLSLMARRKFDGSSLTKLVDQISSEKLRAVFKLFV